MRVFERNGTWWIDVRQNGKRIRRSAGTGITTKQAIELARKVAYQLQESTFNQKMERAPNITFGDALLKWIQSGAPKSMFHHMKATRPFMEHVQLKDSVTAAASMKQTMLQKGLSNLTINRRLAVIKRVLNLCYREWSWLHEPLAEKISLLPEKTSRHIYLSKPEVQKLVEYTKDPASQQIILLAAYTGLRRGEIFNLTSTDIQGNKIFVRKSKNGRPRIVPYPDNLINFTSYLPLEITMYQFDWQFRQARKKAGLNHVRFHDLRHTCASWLAASGVSMGVIRDWLGHSNLQVTSRYMHLATNELDSAMERMMNA